jgi:hypothetical protein
MFFDIFFVFYVVGVAAPLTAASGGLSDNKKKLLEKQPRHAGAGL